MSEVEFVAGMLVKAPQERAPDFVKATISIKVAEFVPWLKEKMQSKEEWINLDVKESRGGKWFVSVNTYKPKEKEAPKPADPFDDSGIPF